MFTRGFLRTDNIFRCNLFLFTANSLLVLVLQKEERLLGDLLLNLPVADVSKQHGSKEQTGHGVMEHKAFNILYVSVRLHHQTWAEDFPPDLRSEASTISFSRWT
ncbi:hypothetical protein XENOCAPTIV_022138 [Xenoophorus captivus]|uniref:Secreted protein n=1 Tax=Xenoophorus captivus TaxID=1517983 RepID=A0ABV0SA36_9TELE